MTTDHTPGAGKAFAAEWARLPEEYPAVNDAARDAAHDAAHRSPLQSPEQQPSDGSAAPAPAPRYGGAPAPATLSSGRIIAMVVAALLAFAAVVAVGVQWLWPAVGVGERHGEAEAGKGSWSVPYMPTGETHSTMIRGVWFTDKAVVKALPDGVHAYRPADGKELWTVRNPDGTKLCQASTDSTGDIAVFARGKGDDCSTFAAVDLASGKQLWEHTLDAEDHVVGAGDKIARSGDTVVVSAAGHRTSALRAGDGTLLWKETAELLGGKDCHGTLGISSMGYTGGRRLVRLQSCWNEERDTVYDAVGVDPATGRAQWAYRLGEHGGEAKVLTTSPVVVNVPESRDMKQLRPVVLDDAGRLRTRLAGGPDTDRELLTTDGSPAANVQIKGDRIFVVAQDEETDATDNNKMVAWSLTDGQRLWEQRSRGYQQTFYAVASDTDDVLAYMAGNIHDPARLVRFDPATGRRTLVRRYPPTPRTAWIGADPLALISRGRLYLSAGFVSEKPGEAPRARQKALIVLPAS
ncbi:PQQ-like beta-propeller repeat protein [Streptomyces sp. ET3-23]|uniref:outer membrane protein assembly factor BamB family protein n=1 Tax=Streptomyces sp. ET3-23 TaxID=2885643 RepID=UPI001D12AFFA|nr:PQQ-binding-like beta-propeller repeat protein [Streptomyces sp. ET3-23]MCC2279844.1 PQQ-like beta-propeller repeat protein [Streptomyces sp. ET3-23]